MSEVSHNRKVRSRTKKGSVSSSNQADLFSDLDSLTEPTQFCELDITIELLGALKQSLRLARQRGLSVERVVDRMNALLPKEKRITARQLYAWCAESREQHRFPAEYIPVFCVATQCDAALRLLANAINQDLVDERERAYLQLGENLMERTRLAREQRELSQKLDR